MTQTVLILGANGKIGFHSARVFEAAGWHVRTYDRSTNDMVGAAQGADVIINGLNPPMYHDWENTIPAITNQVIAAAKASGATVVIPGNIYNYGDQPGELNEHTPHLAHTRKGKVRIDMEKTYAASGVQTIILRAGNFIDPEGNGDVMSMLMLRSIKSGKLTIPSPKDTRQAYAYVPDWARAAVALCEKRGELSIFEDVPFPGHAFDFEALKTCVEDHLDRPVSYSKFPWWAMALASPFIEVAREMREMRYLYEMNHSISGAKFKRLLPDFVATDMASVMTAGLRDHIHPNKAVRTGR